MSRRSWRLYGLLREGALNTIHGGQRTILLTALVTVLYTAGASLLGAYVDGLISSEVDLTARGQYVVEIVPSENSPYRLKAAECENVRSQAGVVNSGALVQTGLASVFSAPRNEVRWSEVTLGYLRTLDLAESDQVTNGLVGREVASEFGAGPTANLLVIRDGVGATQVTIDRFILSGKRTQVAERSILTVTPPIGLADSCVVEVSPQMLDTIGIQGVASLADFSSGEVVARSLTGRSESDSPRERLAEVPVVAVGVGVGFGIGSLWLMSFVFRRSERGLYRALGTQRIDMAIISMIEGVFLLFPSALLASGVVALHGGVTHTFGVAILTGLHVVLLATLVALAMVSFVPLAQIGGSDRIDALKDR